MINPEVKALADEIESATDAENLCGLLAALIEHPELRTPEYLRKVISLAYRNGLTRGKIVALIYVQEGRLEINAQ